PWREGESAQMVQIYGAPEGSRVEILDLSGQRMAELEPNEPYIWDSLDAAFDEVPSGVYILRIVLPNGNVEFLKVAIIR
ncbi:T9SS type A sorting domain-containing protein, partial [bacterium]|nr:T9SS type A sorting domain-containing protein [bacterium]